MKQLEAKRIEKERNEKYQKLKGDAKDARAKYREKYKLDASPDPSDAEEESDEDEDDGFGAKKKEEDQDPAASELSTSIFSIFVWYSNIYNFHHCLEAKAMAEKAMKDPMSLVNNVGALKFW